MLSIGHEMSRMVLVGVAASFSPVGATLLTAGILGEHGQMFKGGLTILMIGAIAAVGWLIATAVNIAAVYEAGFATGYDQGREAGSQPTRLTVVPPQRVPRHDVDGF